MTPDLLTIPNEWHQYLTTQSTLGDDMLTAWQSDLDTIMRDGRIPNWIELDALLQQDESRLLNLIEESAGYVMGDPVTVNYGANSEGLLPVDIVRHVDSLTFDAGFESPGNCKATVNRCIANGWIERGVDKVTGNTRYDLTSRGRWVMDLTENDEWFGESED